MLTKKQGPTQIWMWAYILVNVVATWWMLFHGELIGDLQGQPVTSAQRLLWACVMVVSAYWLLLGPAFNFFARLPSKALLFGVPSTLLENRLGKFILLAQITFAIFNVSYGVNIAGSNEGRGEAPLGFVWVLLPIDSLFMVYYATSRESRWWLPNLLVYIASNMIRGWSGFFFYIIFIEMCRTARRGVIRWKYIVPIGVVVILLYPLLLNLKWVFRAAASSDISIADGMFGFLDSMLSSDYAEVIGDGIMQIVARLQTTALVEAVMRYSSEVHHAFELGTFQPFWLEGIHGIVYDAVVSGTRRFSLGVVFTTIGGFAGDFDLGSWNTNTGWVGWLIVAPEWAPVLLLYTAALCYATIFLAKKIGMTPLFRDLIWFSWMVYLIPGWLGAFVGFVYTLAVFLALKWLFMAIPTVRMWPQSDRPYFGKH
jgi:hypothetical protein